MNLQDIYARELEAINEMPQKVRDFFTVLMLKNFIAVSLMPIMQDKNMIDTMMRVLNIEFNQLGWEIRRKTKLEKDEEGKDK